MVYEFDWKDTEGDIYSSDEHESLSSAKAEFKKIKKRDEDAHIVESWKYNNGQYRGSWH